MSAAEVLSSAAGVCGVLEPLFDIGDIGQLNGPSGYRLAELIYPRNAADLTVRQVLALLAQISAEQNGAPLSDAPHDGVDHINIERIRQKTVEGRDAEHDSQYVAGELARAAACYALPISDPRRMDAVIFGGAPEGWPWDRKWWKPARIYDDGRGNAVVEPDARIRELEKAGALIAAEIDRVKLANSPRSAGGPGLNKSVIVFGPAGCGKTTNAVRLAKHFGLDKIADAADLTVQPTHRGWDIDTLYLVQERPSWAAADARRVIEFYDAMALVKAGAA